jgi:hypothetical protein
MTGYTKGPWDHRQAYNMLKDEIGVSGRALATVWVRKDDPECDCNLGTVPDEEGEANAIMISATPDMYEALKVAEIASEELCRGQDAANECWNTLRMIRATIAKAEGK